MVKIKVNLLGTLCVFGSPKYSITLWAEGPLLPLLVTGVAHSVAVHLLPFRTYLGFKNPIHCFIFLLLCLFISCWSLAATTLTVAALSTVPPSTRDLCQPHTVDVESSVTQITEQHLVLICRVIASHALLAVRALPLIAGDEVQQVQVEPHTGWV